ncbi:peptidase family m13 domain-containing protein [Ditylenchus destructor]|nr:peptidase family m13 domain-containing protein [Ditylenchus destructor]
MGSQFDLNGNKRNWWDPETKQDFIAEKQCLIDQYSNYMIRFNETYSQPLDGVKTQGENIADNGGTRAAYYAWLNFMDDVDSGDAYSLSPYTTVRGLEDFTDEQLFFVGAAFPLCARYSANALNIIMNIKKDEHSIDEARVNAVMRNLPEFADAFNCPAGSGMNPAKKCSVW